MSRLGLVGAGACVVGSIMSAVVAAGPNLNLTGSDANAWRALLATALLFGGAAIFFIGVGMLILAMFYRLLEEPDEESSSDSGLLANYDPVLLSFRRLCHAY